MKACEVIGAAPDTCYALEDSKNGLLSAYRAGCKPLMVPDLCQKNFDGLLSDTISEIKELLEGARGRVAIQVNQELLTTYWEIGQIIVRYEQNDQIRAAYGEKALKQLSKELTKEFGKGFSVSNIQHMRRFYMTYEIQQTLSVKLSWSHYCELLSISDSDKRHFYERECENSRWSVRELKRQIENVISRWNNNL